MKRTALLLVVLAAAVAALSTGADANAMDHVVITGTYASSASSTAFSGPNETFTLTFTVPTVGTLEKGGTIQDGGIAVTIGFGGSSTTLTDLIEFFPSGPLPNGGGGLNVSVIFGTDTFEWELGGAQLFNSSNALVPGNSGISSSQFTPELVIMDNDDNSFIADITGGTFDISSTAATPEPSSLLLLGTGLLGLGAVIRRKFAHT